MTTRLCITCNQPIPPERLEALPNTQTCVTHSQATRPIGYMVPNAAKGTAPSLCIVPDNPEAQRIALRANKRSR